MKGPNVPPPPDPRETAGAQFATNIGTAIANNRMANMDQFTPEGSLTYQQVGTYEQTDPNTGNVYHVPRFRATTSLTPEAQATFDANQRAERGLAETAANQSEFLQGYLEDGADLSAGAARREVGAMGLPPVEMSNLRYQYAPQIGRYGADYTEDRIYDMSRRRVDTRMEEGEDALRTRLANQGIHAGSEAFDREMRGFNEARNDAYNQLALDARGQAVAEGAQYFGQDLARRGQFMGELNRAFDETYARRGQAMNEQGVATERIAARRNQPINEITALLSGSQVAMPNVQVRQQSTMPTVNYAGLVQDNYQSQVANANASANRRNALFGGLIGAAGTLGGGYLGTLG